MAAFSRNTPHPLQDPLLHIRFPAPSAEFIAARQHLHHETGGSQQLSSLKFGNEREYICYCQYDTLHRGTLQWHPATSVKYATAPFTMSTIELGCSELRALNSKFLSWENSEKSFLLIRANPPS